MTKCVKVISKFPLTISLLGLKSKIFVEVHLKVQNSWHYYLIQYTYSIWMHTKYGIWSMYACILFAAGGCSLYTLPEIYRDPSKNCA